MPDMSFLVLILASILSKTLETLVPVMTIPKLKFFFLRFSFTYFFFFFFQAFSLLASSKLWKVQVMDSRTAYILTSNCSPWSIYISTRVSEQNFFFILLLLNFCSITCYYWNCNKITKTYSYFKIKLMLTFWVLNQIVSKWFFACYNHSSTNKVSVLWFISLILLLLVPKLL